jgi:hypothetical protein
MTDCQLVIGLNVLEYSESHLCCEIRNAQGSQNQLRDVELRQIAA